MKNLTLYSYRLLHVRTLPLWFFFFIIIVMICKIPLIRVDWFFWLAEHSGLSSLSRIVGFLETNISCIHLERRETCQYIHPMSTPLGNWRLLILGSFPSQFKLEQCLFPSSSSFFGAPSTYKKRRRRKRTLLSLSYWCCFSDFLTDSF